MSKYLTELFHKLILIIITLFSFLTISYYYKNALLFLVTYMHINRLDLYFIFTNILELFYCYIQFIIFFSSQITSWYLLYHLFIFFLPSFYNKEFKVLVSFFSSISITYVAAMLFSSYILIPYTWEFFLSFQNLQGFYFEARLHEYLNFFISTHLLYLTYYQLVFLIFYFIDIQKNKKKRSSYRKIYYYFFLILSTCISPPDLLTQMFFAILIIIIYEFIFFIQLWIYRF
jgi:sec-independent protein translocase protein TatC